MTIILETHPFVKFLENHNYIRTKDSLTVIVEYLNTSDYTASSTNITVVAYMKRGRLVDKVLDEYITLPPRTTKTSKLVFTNKLHSFIDHVRVYAETEHDDDDDDDDDEGGDFKSNDDDLPPDPEHSQPPPFISSYFNEHPSK